MRYIRKTLQTGMDTVLSIVIVEYHSIGEIQRCVASLRTHVKVPYEVVVSSNSCYSAQQQEAINETPPLEGEGWGEAEAAVRWIFNERNGGFAYAMNEGLKVARGRYLAIMNSDCTLESDIDGMIRFMEDHPAIGAIAPQMRDAEGNIQDTARPYVSVPRYVWRQTKRIVRHKISVLDTQMDYSLTQTTDWVIGAFIMVSRKAYELTGGLDNRFFMYAEDLDWCTRIRQQGLEVVYYPQVLITYKGTRRARSNSKYAKIFISSHIKYWKKFGFFYGYPPRKKCIYTV